MNKAHFINVFVSSEASVGECWDDGSSGSLARQSSVYINIVKDCNAKCDLPNIYDNMVSCPECDNWFHYRCATDTTKECFSDCSFVCSNCKDKHYIETISSFQRK
jgi:hypothetical protein